MINCSYEFSEYNIDNNDMIDTYWKPFVTCNSSCPIEDPLFCVDTLDPITRMLQPFDPIDNQKIQSNQPTLLNTTETPESPLTVSSSISTSSSTAPSTSAEPSKLLSSAPTTERPKVLISRSEFLGRISASEIHPSTRTVFLPNFSFQVKIDVRGQVLLSDTEDFFSAATLFSLGQENPTRRYLEMEQYHTTRNMKDMAELNITAIA